MGTNPYVNRILDGIRYELSLIRDGLENEYGHVYSYTADKVIRVPHFNRITNLLGTSSGGPYYFVRDDGERVERNDIAEFGEHGWTLEVPVVVALQDTREASYPFDTMWISPGEAQQLMLGDVESALTGANQDLGGLDIYEIVVRRAVSAHHDVIKSWIIGELFIAVSYVRPIGAV